MARTPLPELPALDERLRLAVETLYKEFHRVQAKSAATDDWFFRFISIAVVPFLVFLAYSLMTPSYRIFIAALPVLSLIGVLVVAVLTSHYLYAGAYGAHLQHRINVMLGARVMRDFEYGRAAYNGFTPVTVSYAFGLLLLVVLNVLAVPLIDHEVQSFHSRNAKHLGAAAIVLRWYWPVMIAALSAVVIAAAGAFANAALRLRRVMRDGPVDSIPPAGGPAESALAVGKHSGTIFLLTALMVICRWLFKSSDRT